MDLYQILIVVFISLMSFSRISGQDSADYVQEAVQIFNTIFHKYNLDVPPRKSFPDPLFLGVNLHLSHVADLNDNGQFMESTIDLQVTWQDSRLSWYPRVVHEITVKQDLIWNPDLSIDNAISKPTHVADPRLVIDAAGNIYWFKRLNIKTTCLTQLSNTSECDIVIGSNLLDGSVINFDLNTSSCDVTDMISAHNLNVTAGDKYVSNEERWLKNNATFPEFVCTFNVKATPQPSNTCTKPLLNSFALALMFIICMYVIKN